MVFSNRSVSARRCRLGVAQDPCVVGHRDTRQQQGAQRLGCRGGRRHAADPPPAAPPSSALHRSAASAAAAAAAAAAAIPARTARAAAIAAMAAGHARECERPASSHRMPVDHRSRRPAKRRAIGRAQRSGVVCGCWRPIEWWVRLALGRSRRGARRGCCHERPQREAPRSRCTRRSRSEQACRQASRQT